MSLPTPLINVMDAAARASRRLVRDFGEIEQLQVSRKGPETCSEPIGEQSKFYTMNYLKLNQVLVS